MIDRVERIANDIANSMAWADWRNNVVGNGVKSGPPMMRGELHSEYYFSYRCPTWKRASYFAVFQETDKGPIRYKVKAHDSYEQVVSSREEAIVLFSNAIR